MQNVSNESIVLYYPGWVVGALGWWGEKAHLTLQHNYKSNKQQVTLSSQDLSSDNYFLLTKSEESELTKQFYSCKLNGGSKP